MDDTPAVQPLTRTLQIVDVSQTLISLGRGPGPAKTAIDLRTDSISPLPPAAARPIKLRIESFRRGDNPQVPQAVTAYGDITSPQTVTLVLCIGRQDDGSVRNSPGPFRIDPGAYTGALTITDERLPVTTVPFTFNIAYSNPWILLMSLPVILLAGSLYLMVTLKQGDNEKIAAKDFEEFLKTPTGLAAIIAGTASALTVYLSTYISSDTWGSSSVQYVTLFFSMFGAFVASGTAFRWATNLNIGRGGGG
jgi:hypothetical protein